MCINISHSSQRNVQGHTFFSKHPLFFIPFGNNRLYLPSLGFDKPTLSVGCVCVWPLQHHPSVHPILSHPILFLPAHLISFCILRVRGAWSSRGAMYPNHISTRANPQDSWGIFTAQLQHELDSSFMAHLRKPPCFHQPAIVTPLTPPNQNTHTQSHYN